MYSFGGPDKGSLAFLFPKFPVHNTVSFRMTMADRAGRLTGFMVFRSKISTWKWRVQHERKDIEFGRFFQYKMYLKSYSPENLTEFLGVSF